KTGEDLVIGRALDLDPFQSLMSIFNELGKAFQIESWRLDHVPVVVGIADQTGKAVLQKIQISGGALNVGECCRIGSTQEIEPCAPINELGLPLGCTSTTARIEAWSQPTAWVEKEKVGDVASGTNRLRSSEGALCCGR